jgi:hypothetical protein
MGGFAASLPEDILSEIRQILEEIPKATPMAVSNE